MTLTPDERRALAFVALLLTASAVVRILKTPGAPLSADAEAMDIGAKEDTVRGLMAGAAGTARTGTRSRTRTGEDLPRPPVWQAPPPLEVMAPEPDPTGDPRNSAASASALLRASARTAAAKDTKDRGSAKAPSRGPDATAPRRDPPVDLNRADAAELETIPGIGPALAGRIVAWREANGRFRTLDDLVKVRGIGPKTLEKLRPYLRGIP